MGDLGFWALAHDDPSHLALVAPDGTEYTAAELLGRTNQVVHGLRRLGMETGDVVATLLPNGVEMFELYLAALQAGWYLVPINHHLVAPEIAYILKDSGAKAFVAHGRFAAEAEAGAWPSATSLGSPRSRPCGPSSRPTIQPTGPSATS
jgi:long-chain acyl-CoA synthetase